MGTSHAATGLLAGAGVGTALGAEWSDTLVCAAVGAGAALLPDVDEPGSTVGRSLGPVSRVAASGLRGLSRAVFTRTATEADLAAGRDGGHRHLTHTLPAVAAFALLGFLAALPGAIGTALAVGAMAALGLGTIARSMTWAGRSGSRQAAVLLLALACALGAAFAPGGAPWLIGLAVAAGALAHILGDWLTKSGVPLAWPLRVQGARWHMLRSPLPFATGDAWPERGIRVVSLLGFGLVGLSSLPAALGA